MIGRLAGVVVALVTYWTSHTGADHAERHTIRLHEKASLHSLNYPVCCSPIIYLIQYNGGPGTGYLRMIFDDLDIPPDSTLNVYDGPVSTSPLYYSQPRFLNGQWSRPVVASTGRFFFVNFTAAATGHQKYVGFKATFWTVEGPEITWTVDKPYTDCPVIAQTIQSGEVIVGIKHIPRTKIKYRYDCVWVLKPPAEFPEFRVFARIKSMDLEDGTLEIRNGMHSESDVLASYSNVEAQSEARVRDLGQPEGGFESNEEDGLYIRLKKPLNKGYVQFIYGVFTQVNKTDKDCVMLYDTKSSEGHPGFKCHFEEWCIPMDHKCDGINQCQYGSDEFPSLCTTPEEKERIKPISAALGKKEEKPNTCPAHQVPCADGSCEYYFIPCKGQKCATNEYECPSSDQCVMYFGSSSSCAKGGCNSTFEKICADRTCAKKRERCPEEPCPSYSPVRCGDGTCMFSAFECDGKRDCPDGADEPWSCKHNAYILKILIRGGIGLLLLPFVCIIAYCYHSCKAKRKKKQAAKLGGYQESLPVVEEEIQMVETPPHSQPPPLMPHAYGSLESNTASLAESDPQPPPLPGLGAVGNGIDYHNSNEHNGTPNSNDSGVSRGNSTMTEMDRGAVGGISEDIPVERQESLEKLMQSLQGLEDEIDNEVNNVMRGRRMSGVATIPNLSDGSLPRMKTAQDEDTQQPLLQRQDSSYDALDQIANGSFPTNQEGYQQVAHAGFPEPPVLPPVGAYYNSNPSSFADSQHGHSYNPADTSTFQSAPVLPPGGSSQTHQVTVVPHVPPPQEPVYENTKQNHVLYHGGR